MAIDTGFQYDVAVLRLTEPIPFIRPHLLATSPPTPEEPLWLVGFGITACGTVWLLMALTRKLRSAVRTEDRLALAVALGSLAAVATHEIFDFGLSLPANAFTLITVVAAALGRRATLVRLAHA